MIIKWREFLNPPCPATHVQMASAVPYDYNQQLHIDRVYLPKSTVLIMAHSCCYTYSMYEFGKIYNDMCPQLQYCILVSLP